MGMQVNVVECEDVTLCQPVTLPFSTSDLSIQQHCCENLEFCCVGFVQIMSAALCLLDYVMK